MPIDLWLAQVLRLAAGIVAIQSPSVPVGVARGDDRVVDRVEEPAVPLRVEAEAALRRRARDRLVALEVLGDLYRTLDDATASALTEAMQVARKGKRGTLGELRNPWDS